MAWEEELSREDISGVLRDSLINGVKWNGSSWVDRPIWDRFSLVISWISLEPAQETALRTKTRNKRYWINISGFI